MIYHFADFNVRDYPNPFNPVTKITYSIRQPGNTKLVLYDILGRVVEVLVDERQTAGSYEVSFDGRNLASGVYFYRLIVGDFIEGSLASTASRAASIV